MRKTPYYLERMRKMAKTKEIDFKELKKHFESIDSKKSKIGLSLLEEAIFMKKTLDSLKKEIDANGVVVPMSQGKYSIDRANPALSQYNSLIKNYQNCMKQITELLPKNESGNEDDFDTFNS